MVDVDFNKFISDYVELRKQSGDDCSDIKNALGKQGLFFNSGRLEKFKIKSGTYHKCIKDVYMVDGFLAYKNGKTYKSENDKCITDEQGDNSHFWLEDGDYNEHFVQTNSAISDKMSLFKAGDIIKIIEESNNYEWILIFKEVRDGFIIDYSGYCITTDSPYFGKEISVWGKVDEIIYVAGATDQEKKLLFYKMKEQSLRWVENLNRVESIEPNNRDYILVEEPPVQGKKNQKFIDGLVHDFKMSGENFLDKRVSDIYRKGIVDTLEKLRKETQ
jgi:uncharacterized protein YggU (UPF0235/DUF167 family)